MRLRPDYAEALCNLGLALTEDGRPGESAVPLRQATLRYEPGSASSHWTLALALRPAASRQVSPMAVYAADGHAYLPGKKAAPVLPLYVITYTISIASP